MSGSPWINLQTKRPMAPHPGFYAIALSFSRDLDRIVPGANFGSFEAVYRNGTCSLYARQDVREASERAVETAVRKDSSLVPRIRKTFLRKSKAFLRFCDALPGNPDKFSDAELYRLYEEYLARYRDTYLYGEPVAWLTKDALPEYLLRYLRKRKVRFGDMSAESLLGALISDDRLSFVAEEELEFAKFVERVRTFRTGDEASEASLREDSRIGVLLERHMRKWYWIPYDYGVRVWDEAHFAKELERMLATSSESVRARIDELKRHPRSARRLRSRILRENRIDRYHRRLFAALRGCSFLLDYKKEVFTKAHLFVRPFLTEIFRRCGLGYESGCYLLPGEIREVLLSGVLPDVDEVRGRMEYSLLHTVSSAEPVFLSEKDRETICLEIERSERRGSEEEVGVRGVSAVAGNVRGLVRVVLDARDLDTFSEGEILVTNMTSPDYVLGMRLAAAIVTNEGGITCHAAIVARELKKPCVIGTKVATRVLKDGDLVEVDADRGVVRLLESDGRTEG